MRGETLTFRLRESERERENQEVDEEGENSVAAETLNLLSRTISNAARPATSPRSAPELSRDDDW